MDVDDGGDDVTDPRTQIVIHEVDDGEASDECVCTVYDGGAGDHYNVDVEQILEQSRRQAQAMMSAQIQLHNRQTVNHDQVLAISQAYTQAQVAIQQNTELRFQAALTDSHSQSTSAMHAMVEAHADGTKRDIEHRVQLALEAASNSTIANVEAAATVSANEYAKETHSQLESSLQVA